MARIRNIERGTQHVKVHPTEVDCYFQYVDTPTGERLVHLTTFGSETRVSQPKSSQSLQLDRAAAKALREVLDQAFPGLDAE